MQLFGKRVVSALVASALALGGLVGCGNTTATNEPKSAQDVLAQYNKSPNKNNFHSDTDITAEISMAGMIVPVTVNMSLDSVESNVHGTMKMEAMGEKNETELYVVKEGGNATEYMGVTDPTTKKTAWSKVTLENAFLTDQIVDEKIMQDATFEKTDNGYTIKVAGAKALEALASSGANITSTLESMGGEAMKQALEKTEMVYQFDKDCMLTSATMDMTADITAGEGQASLSGTMKLGFSMKVSNYGGIDASAVALPDDVKKNATEDDISEALSALENLDTAA